MSESKPQRHPYRVLGTKLKNAREQRKETLAEVSGAVEIDSETLELFEQGVQRPSEDILMLLISYFDFKDEEATKFWELAGYGDKNGEATQTSTFDLGQPVAMVMPMDLRVIYTDMVNVMVNNYGVVMNFMQNAGPNNQPLAVARIGMSKEHAKSVLHVLQQSLAQQETKTLPQGKTPKTDSTKTKKQDQ